MGCGRVVSEYGGYGGSEYGGRGWRKGGLSCGCMKCRRKHSMMFWTIVGLLLVIIMLLMKQMRMI